MNRNNSPFLYLIDSANNGIIRLIGSINRVINCIILLIGFISQSINTVPPMIGKVGATCRPPAASCTSSVYRHRWLVWSVNLRPAGCKLLSLGVYRRIGHSRWLDESVNLQAAGCELPSLGDYRSIDSLMGTDDWFGRSTCGPLAASSPPLGVCQ